jgi:hypothetical protein
MAMSVNVFSFIDFNVFREKKLKAADGTSKPLSMQQNFLV